ncbi:hypothetical protein F4804DRAFT_183065 [Jackrogersella minutella]|nr:hypothetical protein F4804DRAFT_183065 [Jackrogersella minutella]
MSSKDQSPEGTQETSHGQESGNGLPHRRRRGGRRGMPEEERRARQQRRLRLRGQQDPSGKTKAEGSEATGSNTPGAATEQEISMSEPIPTEAEVAQGRKPWESIVIGDLGENLSYIEEKDREIERHRYIVKYHQENSPGEAAHHQKILDRLVKERSEMEDNEENNMPENQREEKNRIGERLEMLNWALDTSQCEAEEINIRAAMQGYQSGEIGYSDNFTLIYAGHIVDTCPTYQSFCEDRQERLDRYSERFGPGWLWHEPPLTEGSSEVLGKKGLCLERNRGKANYNIGNYPVHLRFTVDRRKVSRGKAATHGGFAHNATPPTNPMATCHLKTLLDCGATYPILPVHDLQYLDVNLRWYPAQGVAKIITVTEIIIRRFFELYVTVCSESGETLVGEGTEAVWPQKARHLGGFCPVVIDPNKTTNVRFVDRLSGMLPFEACYISAAPTTYEVWLGEDRRDVLGARRMPAHLRYDPEANLNIKYPEEFEHLREQAKTPDQVIFVHHLNETAQSALTDGDWPAQRGKSELAIMENQFDESEERFVTRTTTSAILEPRNSTIRSSRKTPLWRRDFLSKEDFEDKSYREVYDRGVKDC